MNDNKSSSKNIRELLDKLLINAEELVAVSSHDVSETELQRLQQVQEGLLSQLQEFGEDISKETYVSDKLEQFVQLNRKYIENLARYWGVLDFYKKNVKTISQEPLDDNIRDKLP